MPFRNSMHRRKGGMTIEFFGVFIVLLMFAMLFLELIKLYDIQYAIEVRAQRAVNSATEYAMDDSARADGYNFMLEDKAREALADYLKSDLAINDNGEHKDSSGNIIYKCEYNVDHAEYSTGNPKKGHSLNRAYIKIPIKVTIQSNYGIFGGPLSPFKITFEHTYVSTNFRVDDDERAGWTLLPGLY